MYKKIQASSELIPVRAPEVVTVDEKTDSKALKRYREILKEFSADLKKARLKDFEKLDASIDWGLERHYTIELASGICREGCFYVLRDGVVVYITKVIPKADGIDLIELSRIGDMNDG